MRAHLAYLRYVLRHKWFVLLAGLDLGVPLWQLLIHDWSKFLPREWFPYVGYFDTPKERQRPDAAQRFDLAWNHHQKVQPHHWQHWLLVTDSDAPRLRPLPMPDRFVREMIADWRGAGRALARPDTVSWYIANSEQIILHPDTRRRVEQLLEIDDAA